MASFNQNKDNTLPPENIQDDFQWGRKPVENFRECVLRAIEKCRLEGSKQMIRGAGTIIWMRNPESGKLEKVSLLDQRKIYRECVNMFEDLMLYYFDEEIEEEIEEIKKEEVKTCKRILSLYLESETNESEKERAKKMGQIIGTDIGKKYMRILENKKHDLDRRKFRELLLLFKRKNDLRGTKTLKAY